MEALLEAAFPEVAPAVYPLAALLEGVPEEHPLAALLEALLAALRVESLAEPEAPLERQRGEGSRHPVRGSQRPDQSLSTP
jgi:hypothetical protein